MSVSDEDTRELSFPLQNPLVIVGDTPDDGTPIIPFEWQTEDNDEKVIVTLELSLNEYVALASAVDVGRDIAYGIDTNLIWWIWCRSINTMAFCEQVIACIESDPEVATTIIQFLTDNGYGSPGQNGMGTPNNPGIYQANPLLIDGSTIEDCDNDNLFGAITQLIDFINRRIVDLFEVIEAETNIIERTQLALGAFPPTDLLATDEAAAFADQLIEEIMEGYDAAFTEELEDEYRCDLFCIVKDTCELDFQTMSDYFSDRVGAVPPAEAFSEYIEWFVTGSFVGTTIVDAAYALVFSLLAYGSDAFGIKIGALLTSINAALNDPNSDWTTLCEDCLPPPAVEPEIGIEPCSGALGAAAGTNLVNTTGVTWTGASTARASDHALTIVRAGGGLFHVGNIVGLTGTISFYGWKLDGASCAAGASPPSIENDFEMFMFTGPTAFTVQFSFEGA